MLLTKEPQLTIWNTEISSLGIPKIEQVSTGCGFKLSGSFPNTNTEFTLTSRECVLFYQAGMEGLYDRRLYEEAFKCGSTLENTAIETLSFNHYTPLGHAYATDASSIRHLIIVGINLVVELITSKSIVFEFTR